MLEELFDLIWAVANLIGYMMVACFPIWLIWNLFFKEN